MNATRLQGLLAQAARPETVANTVAKNAKKIQWGPIFGWGFVLLVIIGIIVGFATGAISVRLKNCAGGTAGVGTNKEKGCLCSSGKECASGACPMGIVTMAVNSGPGAVSNGATGKCA